MPDSKNPSQLRIMGFMGLFVLIGLPLVAFLWETLNDVLALKVESHRVLLAIPIVLLFAGLLYALKKGVRRIYPVAQDPPSQSDE